ncbi:MAG TPA: DotU family type IV/VI secretion system protein [Chthoniobacterales bacterium]
MTPLELCEPLFNKICVVNRMGRKGAAHVSYDQLRAEIEGVFKDLQARAETEPALRAQWSKLEMPLVFFVDSMIAESKAPFAATWHVRRLAYQEKELAGDEKFFDLLDETLADPSPEATERLKVFYTCLGLGFCGWYAAQPDYLRGKEAEIAARLHLGEGRQSSGRISPEAYQCLDTRDLIQPRLSRLSGLAIVFAGLFLIVVAVEVYLYKTAAISITDTTSAVATQDPRRSTVPAGHR